VITIGADPELFAFREGVPISVHDLLPGTKFNPCKVPRGAVQVDGVAAEFNITPAAKKRDFIQNITHVHKILEKLLKNKDLKINLKAVPTVHFDKKYFEGLPTEAKALGCEPDYNAYSMKANDKPETDKPMRTGSGHIHVGWGDDVKSQEGYVQLVQRMVKELDFVLYKQSIHWDNDVERMDLYGKPGSFRFKPYGLEYRVLSNKWVGNKALMAFIFDATYSVANYVLEGKNYSEGFPSSEKTYEAYIKEFEIPFVGDYADA